MRFGSYKDLTQFLKGLADIGYSVPFLDYEKEMRIKGFSRHIHNYECKIDDEDTTNDKIILVFTDNSNGNTTNFIFEKEKK